MIKLLLASLFLSTSAFASDCPDLAGNFRMSLDGQIIKLNVTQGEKCEVFNFHYIYPTGTEIKYNYVPGTDEPVVIFNDAVRSVKVSAEVKTIIVGEKYKKPALKLTTTEYSRIYEDTLESTSLFFTEDSTNVKSLVERRDYLEDTGKYFYRVYMGYIDN